MEGLSDGQRRFQRLCPKLGLGPKAIVREGRSGQGRLGQGRRPSGPPPALAASRRGAARPALHSLSGADRPSDEQRLHTSAGF